MHIAYLGIKGLPSAGGADRVVEAVAWRLAQRHTISVYCSGRVVPPKTTFAGGRLIRIPGLGGKMSHMASVDFLAACHAVLKGDYDLIHLHNLEASFVLPILRLRYKVIATAHGRFTASNKWGRTALILLQALEYPFVYGASACTSVSAQDAQYFSGRYHRPVRHIPNGVEPLPEIAAQAAGQVLADYGLLSTGYVFCAAGRIIPLKGIHLLLEAWRGLETDRRLVVAGDLTQSPSYAAQLRQLADERVVFMPFVRSRAVLFSLMQRCAIFVFPSTQEAMSMTLLEAAAVGAPILCSDIPANQSVLPKDALFFHNGDAEDLRLRLAWALQHPEEMTNLGERARQWVQVQFSWEKIALEYEAMYQYVAGL